jgi:hypothetical protein
VYGKSGGVALRDAFEHCGNYDCRLGQVLDTISLPRSFCLQTPSSPSISPLYLTTSSDLWLLRSL